MNPLRKQRDFGTTSVIVSKDTWDYLIYSIPKSRRLLSYLSALEIARMLMLWVQGGRNGVVDEDVADLLNVTTSVKENLLTKLSQEGMLQFNRGHWRAPEEVFYKSGSKGNGLNAPRKSDIKFPVKIHLPVARQLFAEGVSNKRRMEDIGNCFKLLPYMNLKYGVLCRDPFENELGKISTLSQVDITALLGMSEINVSRMLRRMKEPVIINDRPFYLFGQVRIEGGRRAHMPNARLFYTRETDPLLFSWDFSEIGTIKNWDDI